MRPHRMGDLFRELRPRLEDMARCGRRGCSGALERGPALEAVHVGLEDPVGMVERFGDAKEPHGDGDEAWGTRYNHRMAVERLAPLDKGSYADLVERLFFDRGVSVEIPRKIQWPTSSVIPRFREDLRRMNGAQSRGGSPRLRDRDRAAQAHR